MSGSVGRLESDVSTACSPDARTHRRPARAPGDITRRTAGNALSAPENNRCVSRSTGIAARSRRRATSKHPTASSSRAAGSSRARHPGGESRANAAFTRRIEDCAKPQAPGAFRKRLIGQSTSGLSQNYISHAGCVAPGCRTSSERAWPASRRLECSGVTSERGRRWT